jgi:hypothetical protein
MCVGATTTRLRLTIDALPRDVAASLAALHTVALRKRRVRLRSPIHFEIGQRPINVGHFSVQMLAQTPALWEFVLKN